MQGAREAIAILQMFESRALWSRPEKAPFPRFLQHTCFYRKTFQLTFEGLVPAFLANHQRLSRHRSHCCHVYALLPWVIWLLESLAEPQSTDHIGGNTYAPSIVIDAISSMSNS